MTLVQIDTLKSARYQSPPPVKKQRATQTTSDSLNRDAQPLAKDHLTVGAVVLTGLSVLGAMVSMSRPAEAVPQLEQSTQSKEISPTLCLTDDAPIARVVILDDFANSETGTTHGESVQQELLRHHQSEGAEADIALERHQVGLWGGDFGLSKGETGSLQSYLRDHFAGRMTRDTEALQNVLKGNGPRAVIHQSQGSSQSRVVDGLYYRSLRDSDFLGKVQAELGLEQAPVESKSEKAEFLTHLVSAAEAIAQKDPEVIAARAQLRQVQDQAHAQGHIHVISAGNQGYLGRDMQDLGVTIPESFFTNEFASPHSIIVGASDNGSKTTTDQAHQVANLASPNVGAHISADGVDRPLEVDGKFGHHSGSSYAAPQVSSAVIDILRANPEWNRDQILNTLQSQATPVPGSESFLGAGTLNAPTTLLCQ